MDELENMNSSPTLLLCYQPEIFLLSADKSQLGGREVWLAARLLITPPPPSSLPLSCLRLMISSKGDRLNLDAGQAEPKS